MAKYVDGINLPEEMTLRKVMRALEAIGEVGEGHWNQGQPRISFEVPLEGQDIWGLRDTLEELRGNLQSNAGLDFEPKQENILWESGESVIEEFKRKGRDEVLERVIPGLRDLALKGYQQPQYNGRPSCPFCLSFVDEDEEHSHDCSLVRFLDMCENDGLDDPLNASIRLEINW